MTGERYSSQMDGAAGFGLLANALFDGGEDKGAMFPRSDAEDLSRGARFIPGAVTEERRAGKEVVFVTNCGSCCWYWELDDGSRIYHYDPGTYASIGEHNHDDWGEEKQLAGPCPQCGNPHTNGGAVAPPEAA